MADTCDHDDELIGPWRGVGELKGPVSLRLGDHLTVAAYQVNLRAINRRADGVLQDALPRARRQLLSMQSG